MPTVPGNILTAEYLHPGVRLSLLCVH
jgi:hypothetical protein